MVKFAAFIHVEHTNMEMIMFIDKIEGETLKDIKNIYEQGDQIRISHTANPEVDETDRFDAMCECVEVSENFRRIKNLVWWEVIYTFRPVTVFTCQGKYEQYHERC